MLRVGFELTIPVFERAKAVHALDRTTIMIDCESILLRKIFVESRDVIGRTKLYDE
jgi:hypothetical protein